MERCGRCGRPREKPAHEDAICAPCRGEIARAVGGIAYVVHDYYGCESGCCGHRAYVEDARGNVLDSEFEFLHDEEQALDMALALAAKWDVDLDPGRCEFRPDC
jgi:hypothetical protein